MRTKENIARVRKDEAEAAEKEKQERLRIETADREARLNVLKNKSKQWLTEAGILESEQHPQKSTVTEHPQPTAVTEHINLFADFDNHIKTTNKEHDQEVKEKTEEYEKKIGYLTYLGQDTNEALKKKNWYEVLPEASRFSRSSDVKDTYDKLVLKDQDGKPKIKEVDVKDGEIAWKAKQKLDPMNAFKEFCTGDKFRKIKQNATVTIKSMDTIIDTHRHKSKKKKYKQDKEDKEKKLQKLREARLKREQQEKYRTDMLLTGLNGPANKSTEELNIPKLKPKYNSQFNPELARQNYR